MNYEEPIRKTVVREADVVRIEPKDGLLSKRELEGKTPTTFWQVLLRIQEGMLPPRLHVESFHSESEAKELVDQHPIGREVNLSQRTFIRSTSENKEKFFALMDTGWLGRPRNAGEEESPLAFNDLDESGLTKGLGGKPAPGVLTALGEKRLEELKNKHGDNWNVAAVFEYCFLHLPESSPAYVAAAYQFHYYVTQDLFSAGYYWRDLECLAHGVETAAIATRDMRQKASKASGEKSSSARIARRTALLDAMEAVAERNPDVLKLGAKPLANLALARSMDENPSLWSQGKGQIEEYLGEIRRGEAGDNMRARYHSLFPAKPPKRLR
jgi:hypothetical protein